MTVRSHLPVQSGPKSLANLEAPFRSARSVTEDLWLLVFDLDGTLIDSSQDLCDSVNAALRSIGDAPLPKDVISSFIGDGAAILIRRSLLASRHKEELADEQVEFALRSFLLHYRQHKLDTTSLYPGVLDAFRALRADRPELLMAVLTNKPVRPSREICSALGVASYFFAIYGGDSFTTKKPHVDGLLAVIRQGQSRLRDQKTSPQGVVMIGDSDVDVLTARRCGVTSLGCLYGLAPEALTAAKPDLMVASPKEWPSALRHW